MKKIEKYYLKKIKKWEYLTKDRIKIFQMVYTTTKNKKERYF